MGRVAKIVSDNGSQFRSIAFGKANRGLGIDQHFCEKGRPWQNLIESQFGIQARMGEYAFSRCESIEQAEDVHRDLIKDHNRLPHFAHRRREDAKHAPLEVLGSGRGKRIEAADLHEVFSRKVWKRHTDGRGFMRIGRWKIYVEEGLPKTPIEVIYWDGKMRAEYRQETLAEYACRWDEDAQRPKSLSGAKHFETAYSSRQIELFNPEWLREPVEEIRAARKIRKSPKVSQLRLDFGEEIKAA